MIMAALLLLGLEFDLARRVSLFPTSWKNIRVYTHFVE
jgi:hypothetical protein